MSRAEFSNRNKTMAIKNITVEDEGSFTCVSVNRAGNDSSSVYVEVNGICLLLIYLFASFIYYFTKTSLLNTDGVGYITLLVILHQVKRKQ